MFPPRTIRSIIACTLACGLLATMTSAAAAECPPNLPDGATTSCLPGMTQDLRSHEARDAADAERIARMMEQYYASYDGPKPVTAPATPAPDDSPWLLISVLAGGLALVLAGTAMVLRHRRVAV
jgi:hypothetical protein